MTEYARSTVDFVVFHPDASTRTRSVEGDLVSSGNLSAFPCFPSRHQNTRDERVEIFDFHFKISQSPSRFTSFHLVRISTGHLPPPRGKGPA
jgi:hypothetical protein